MRALLFLTGQPPHVLPSKNLTHLKYMNRIGDEIMFYYDCISIAICIITAYLILLGGNNMGATGWISLTVAVIGVLGVVVSALFQLKRDGKSIDRIDSNTSEMKPTVQSIHKVAEKTQDLLRDSIRPSLDAIQQRTDRIDCVADGFMEFKRLEAYYSDGLVRRDVLLSQISAVFAENTRLNEKTKGLEAENQVLKCENQALKDKIQIYEEEKRRLRQFDVRRTKKTECPDEWEFEE